MSYQYDFPTLPGDWVWWLDTSQFGTKTVIHFGQDMASVGGWYGEIDNYVQDGTEVWTAHIRTVEDDGSENGVLAEEETVAVDFQTAQAAIEAVPRLVGTYFQ